MASFQSHYKVPPSRNDDISHYRPFGPQWMDTAVQETLLPDSPWHQVQDKINVALAKRVEAEIYKENSGEKREALFRVLGHQYVKKYLSQYPYDPALLSPPNIPLQQRQVYEQEMEYWLDRQVEEVVKEEKCQYNEEACQEMKDFIQHTFDVFNTGLDRHLLLKEKQEQLQSRVNTAEMEAGLNNVLPGFIRPIIDDKSTATPGTLPLLTRGSKRMDRHALSHGDKPPNSWSPVSEKLGDSIVAILRRDPYRMSDVCRKLSGKQIPSNLRQYVWTELLFTSDRSLVSKEGNIEKILRNRFAKKVSMGKIDLKLKKATYTPIHGLIWNSVVEMYDSIPSMQPYQTRLYMKECANALNVLYTYNRSYEPYLIQWLFPLQLAYPSRQEQEEKPYELAMYLDLFMSNVFPKWPEIFAMADRTMNKIIQEDTDLADHLQDCALKNIDLDAKQFLVHLIHIEKDKALALGRATPGSEKSIMMSKELLADPVIFIRKWIGEGFVGVLDGQAVLYVWDQCFMNKWKHEVIENVCLAIILLLREMFLETTDYHEMKQVFLQQPARLYTADIQRAYLHLSKGGPVSEVPPLNRYRPQAGLFSRKPTPKAAASPVVSKSPDVPVPSRVSTISDNIEPAELKPIGVKKFKMTLVILQPPAVDDTSRLNTAEKWKKEQFRALSYFEPDHVKVAVSVFYGKIKLRTTHSNVKARHANQSVTQANQKTYYVEIPEEEMIFYNLDPSGFHGARGKHSHPYAIIKVLYQIPPGKDGQIQTVNLGWVQLPLYEQQQQTVDQQQQQQNVDQQQQKQTVDEQPSSTWVILAGDKKHSIRPGAAPDQQLEIVDPEVTYTQDDFLQKGSDLEFRVFDLEVEPPTIKSPTPPPPPPPARPGEPQQPAQRPISPSPSEDFNPRLEGDPWVAHKPSVAVLPSPTDPKDGLDLYIDGVQYIPDNATIIKVTGRLMTPAVKSLEDIAAYPSVKGPARCPVFKYKYPVKEGLVESNLVILRVYTVDKDTKELVVIGSCMMQLFTKQGDQYKLNVGGFQLRIKSGLPDTSKPLNGNSMDALPNVPGCSILIRILPRSETYIEAEDYKSGYYRSQQCEPYISEVRILEHYVKDDKFPLSVTEAIHRLQIDEKKATVGTLEQDENQLVQLLKDRLDKKHLAPKAPPKDLDLTRLINYDISRGVDIQVQSAYGLNIEGLYCNGFVRVSPGNEAIDLERTPEGYGGEEKFLTSKHDYGSLQKSPRWLDMASILHPHHDVNSILLIQIFSLDAVYKPTADGSGPGVVTGKDGEDPKLGVDSQLGWTALPIFNGPYVMQGVHVLPIFVGTPSREFLQMALTTPVLDTFKACIQDKTITLDSNFASMVVHTWDGHYDKDETVPQPRIDEYLTVDKPDKFNKTANNRKGKLMSELVTKTMSPEDVQNESLVKREIEYFEESMSKTFYELMESALMNAGYGPL